MPPRESAAWQQDHGSPAHSSTSSPLSCHSCRRLKRRCDREYPCCGLCQRKQAPCDYPHQRKERVGRIEKSSSQDLSSPSSLLSASSPSSLSLSSNTSPQSCATNASRQPDHLPSKSKRDNAHHQLSELGGLNLLAASFLDPDDFIRAQLETEKPNVVITKHVADLVGSIGDIQNRARIFFESAHTWMPIVSKVQFHRHLLQRLALQRVDLFLLVLAMNLLASRASVAKSMLYRTVKQLYFDVESAGRLSVQSLQAALLIALYELGHGIYPAAIISVASCARHGTLLGVQRHLTNTGLLEGMSWIDVEERRRLWWAIVILDRFINLSHPNPSLVTQDPDPESYLPAADDDYDNGVSPSDEAVQLRLSSQVHLGRFARFAHSVPLLSQAISRSGEDQANSAQLRRTILSLIHLGDVEGMEDRILLCTLNAVSYLAVFTLDNAVMQLRTKATKKQPVAAEVVSPETISAIQHGIEIMTLETSRINLEHLSPFLLHMMYRSLSILLSLNQNPPASMNVSDNIELLKHGLERLQSRWLVAETYLLLAKRQEVFSHVQPA